MEAYVPFGRFVGQELLGFGGAKVFHVLFIAHMVGVFKVGRGKSRVMSDVVGGFSFLRGCLSWCAFWSVGSRIGVDFRLCNTQSVLAVRGI